tara:strand:- start:1589 stop:2056 length:468 start_codon:yes stop_codon:yes gene_type:complete
MFTYAQNSDKNTSWYVYTDQVMGGKSELSANFEEGVVKLDGEVTTKNNGGFVRLAHRPDEINKNAKGIKFKAKGNNEAYEVHVTLKGMKMPPWSYLSTSFDVNDQWNEYQILFSDLKKNGMMAASMKPKNIREISIAGYGRDFNVDLELKDIELF